MLWRAWEHSTSRIFLQWMILNWCIFTACKKTPFSRSKSLLQPAEFESCRRRPWRCDATSTFEAQRQRRHRRRASSRKRRSLTRNVVSRKSASLSLAAKQKCLKVFTLRRILSSRFLFNNKCRNLKITTKTSRMVWNSALTFHLAASWAQCSPLRYF